MKLLFFCLLLVSMSVPAVAGNEKQIFELEAAIMQQQQEQQILFQRFQMLQELRRHEITQIEQALPTGSDVIINGEAPKYEDVARQRKERAERVHRYTDELDELYMRYQETENERRALIEQLNGLKPGQDVSAEPKK
ncbi:MULTISPECIES: hypothetical protein [Nitrosomonas]|uniref:LTXXQ motif family protein n=1 Tax=Nitrosomonas europaea (strain ATCC 19718 / CIP 103999 / KCTC 2705 / NBRC 14298) TaxID=228410 RepID=Q82SK0_NITEU|nr:MULTISPECIES: hypothetical protein [Nitrosomonas]CAD86230.1 hypothetical protein NE2318 [Nitrosomonas europaea ATCC 19718]SDW30550.1 hypothetical protein SAMN05216310_10845 [Nitrosomonas europaea]SES89520.1 hypothetical protein SAMN05216309_10845 [Nitrosomonas europaea]SJZ40041.1 hypothetical protein SAMN02745113_00795 [Nitrosomonas europaea]HBF25906.1 hypothetical protein [Nitrosomonas sp.]